MPICVIVAVVVKALHKGLGTQTRVILVPI